MALPAGRYGVTKNQLLKIKKLPMNTIKLIEELTEKFNLLVTALQGKADNSVIGTVEDGTNPTKSYAIGEHFIRNGKFCTCIVPVTTTSTWSDSYYVEGAVGDKIILTNSGSVTISADSFDTSALTIAIPTGYTPTQCTLYISGSGNARHSSYHPYYDSTNKVVQFVVKNSDTESSHTWGLTGYVDAIKS